MSARPHARDSSDAVAAGGASRSTSSSSVAWLLIGCGLLIAPAWAVARAVPPPYALALGGWVLVTSLVSYVLYRRDKNQAQRGNWRTPESILQLWAFVGGWPGALLAQRRLRHKNAKITFQFIFWVIVSSHQYVALDSVLGWRVARAVMNHLVGG